MFVLHPENSMFSGCAPSNPHTVQTLNTWKEAVLITIIFLLDCQRWAVCFTISCSPYLLLFPPMVIEGGCRPVKVRSEGGGGGGGEEEGQKQRRQRAAGKGRLSFSRETCALLPKFSLCKPSAGNSIDHWLSMRGLTGIHTRARTLTGNFLLTFCHFCEVVFLNFINSVLQLQVWDVFMQKDAIDILNVSVTFK